MVVFLIFSGREDSPSIPQFSRYLSVPANLTDENGQVRFLHQTCDLIRSLSATFVGNFISSMRFPVKTILFPLLCLFTSACADNKGSSVNPQPTGKTVSQLGPNIMVIFQDNQNVHWFGSWETGLYRYDGKTITHYSADDGLPSNRVEEIKQDVQGNILINTKGGLCLFEAGGFRQLHPVLGMDSLWQLQPDDLWFKCIGKSSSVLDFDCQFLGLFGKKHSRVRISRTQARFVAKLKQKIDFTRILSSRFKHFQQRVHLGRLAHSCPNYEKAHDKKG